MYTHVFYFLFSVLDLRIHQEYIIAFQDKLNYREITGQENVYKNSMVWKFNMKGRNKKKIVTWYMLVVSSIQEIDM